MYQFQPSAILIEIIWLKIEYFIFALLRDFYCETSGGSELSLSCCKRLIWLKH